MDEYQLFSKNRSYFISHFLLATLIMANSLTWILKMPNSLAIIVGLSSFGILIINLKPLLSSLNGNSVMFILFIYFFFTLSFLYKNVSDTTTYYFIQFTILGALPIIISNLKINLSLLLKSIVILGVIFIPYSLTFDLHKLDISTYDNVFGMIMGRSYGLLPFPIAAIFLLFLKPKKKLFKILIFIVLISHSLFLFTWGTRGAVLSLIMTPVLFFLIIKKDENKPLGKSVFTLILILFSVFLITYFFDNLLYPALQAKGFSLRFYDKMIKLRENDDVSNGRYEILFYTFHKIIEKPLFGYGIGSGVSVIGIEYPHNLFAQFLMEGGIFMSLPIIALSLKIFQIMFSNNVPLNNKLLILFLFLSAYIQLLFSTYPWQSQVFWLLMGYTINIKTKKTYEDRLYTQSKLREETSSN